LNLNVRRRALSLSCRIAQRLSQFAARPDFPRHPHASNFNKRGTIQGHQGIEQIIYRQIAAAGTFLTCCSSAKIAVRHFMEAAMNRFHRSPTEIGRATISNPTDRRASAKCASAEAEERRSVRERSIQAADNSIERFVAPAAIERALSIYQQLRERDFSVVSQARKILTQRIYALVDQGEADEHRLIVGGLVHLKSIERDRPIMSASDSHRKKQP
jgi:hypothetical protein